jgi:hypothetical protein
VEIMGLLDKVDNLGDDAKKAAPKKAVAKKAVAKKAVAKKAVAKYDPASVEIAKPKAKAAKSKQPRPSGLPEGYELAGKLPRYIGWLMNFGFNFGVLMGTLFIFSQADMDATIPFGLAGVMIIFNWLVLPFWMGRNFGEFVSRTKYINSQGNKPIAIHAILNNSLGFMALLGFILLFVNFQDLGATNASVWFGVGAFMILIWFINFFFKKNSDFSQGIFDLAFGAYLVKHVASGVETGWMARFEGLGDFGDKYQKRVAIKEEKRAEKEAVKEADAAAKADDVDSDSKE